MDSCEKEGGVLEDTAKTRFFGRHSSHLPASFRLEATLCETEDKVSLEIDHPSMMEGEVDVDATANIIKVKIKFKGEDSYFKHTYVMPKPIDDESVDVRRGEEGVLVVEARKISKQ
ncbi:MAG: hypothetical protein GF334_07355 [Candidatus Altiarchaeales archaeon]|nr:hypothetical protein [Candidatus Altiarchaeales archaeon]